MKIDRFLAILFVLLSIPFVDAQQIIFMEPEPSQQKEELPSYHAITDENRLSEYKKWIDNDAARWAFDLFSRAWKIKHTDVERFLLHRIR